MRTNFRQLQENTLKTIVGYCQGLCLEGEEPKQLIAMAKSLVGLVKRSRKAVKDVEVWKTLLVIATETLEQILNELRSNPDTPTSLNAQIISMLITLNELSEKEAEVEAKEEEQFSVSEEEFNQLFTLVSEKQ